MKFHSMTGGCAALLASFFLSGCATDVNGVVRDSETNRPIAGAVVQISEETTATDSEGYYTLEADGDDDDPQKFHVAAPGYMAVSDVRILDSENEPAKIDFNLRATQAERERTGEAQRAREDDKVDVKVNSSTSSTTVDEKGDVKIEDKGSSKPGQSEAKASATVDGEKVEAEVKGE